MPKIESKRTQMPLSNPICLKSVSVAAAMVVLSAVTAFSAPAFWGATYATSYGVDDPAKLSGGLPVHVSALLPGNLACMDVASAQLNDPPPYPRVTNSLRAARVDVVLQESSCPPPGKDRWLKFVVPHPVQADILNLVYTTTSGKSLGNEKVHISGGTGGKFGK
jgi:hypothetical protein